MVDDAGDGSNEAGAKPKLLTPAEIARDAAKRAAGQLDTANQYPVRQTGEEESSLLPVPILPRRR